MPEARTTRPAAATLRLEALAYTLAAAFITLTVATRFYGSLRLQTLYAELWADPAGFDKWVAHGRGPWSAPLDDVFIHFDFARSTARGAPFQWSEGNGYSSGGTSLLYPFVLALGYWGGFRGLSLMLWAAIVACVATFGFLLGARRWARDLPAPARLLLPFGLLAVGTLDWSLFSGMEVALFLALWALAYVTYDDLRGYENAGDPRLVLRGAAVLGGVGGLVVATRPEGVTAIFVLALAASLPVLKRSRTHAALVFGSAMLPALLVLGAQSFANRWFTGESTAAGALVKLEMHHPYLDARQVFDDWLFYIKYQALRVTQYHFADQPAYGWIAWLLGFAALAFRRTRRPALILWSSALMWVLIVALNGQVRWQNERYTMPAVAWLLGAATLGTGALLTRAYELRHKLRGPLILVATTSAVALFLVHQAPRFREQLWFFGRASRNIFDQHVQAGLVLREKITPQPKRVLVGDAGAIPYISDLPALDIIGLGGYHDFPFARATRQHVGAGIELIERMAPSERPDILAIYPSWWGDLPAWFGQPLGAIPVRGNVICGGAAKVLYRPDWSPLDASSRPFSLRAGERLIDAVDEADLISEREHDYRIAGAPGFVTMELLQSPRDQNPLWDAGRTLPPNAVESFYLTSENAAHARLVVRAAPTERVSFGIELNGKAVGRVTLEPRRGWVEASVDHLALPSGKTLVRFGPSDHERILFHVFLIAEP
jgi:hypothetical protein